jgi:hypothetical protein
MDYWGICLISYLHICICLFYISFYSIYLDLISCPLFNRLTPIDGPFRQLVCKCTHVYLSSPVPPPHRLIGRVVCKDSLFELCCVPISTTRPVINGCYVHTAPSSCSIPFHCAGGSRYPWIKYCSILAVNKVASQYQYIKCKGLTAHSFFQADLKASYFDPPVPQLTDLKGS